VPRTATSTIDAKALGVGLRAARTRQSLTQAALAERLTVSTAYVQKLEAGRANPTVGQLAHIARALGCGLRIEFPESPEPIDPLAGYSEF
jgi:transcriptional regulator with XRE-family HTH domain